MLITFAFQMLLHGLCSFRESTFRYSYACMALIPIVFGLFVYFTYVEPSISARIVVSASYLAMVSFSSVKALLSGTRHDLPLAVKMMSGAYFLYGLFMLYRGYHTIVSASVTEFMSASLVHQLTFLFSIFLIVSISFCMLWMINARQLNAINELSFYDSLTKIRNRRALDLFVQDLNDRREKTPRTISLIMLDIDHFKCINDEYGHVVGDRVIQTVSAVLRNTLPSLGLMFRYGGDEVIIVLDDHDIKVTENLAERLRQKIEHAPYVDNLEVQPTCSFGVAQIHTNESWDSVVRRADKALYQAKKNGRNTVCVSTMAELKRVYA
ncbi:GGDEF domain-containing protein [Vibrio methylphosphonaticus]|uniref:GGDEF domain-containing protein n=1 Tax=Vibrio methylphosphonaticus TaxID=2946866 RepID=UPI002029F8F1|nr:GGDEF domain-containing protein [Vibrio methylphosphonaticus]MCL9773886.1 GGDEF domain-containing protein [Vibrio methylphosphonaticus]